MFAITSPRPRRALHSFPTRRSSDLPTLPIVGDGEREPNDTYVEQLVASARAAVDEVVRRGVAEPRRIAVGGQDRKSTRLNSSHLVISYAVFCLKKKRINTRRLHEVI